MHWSSCLLRQSVLWILTRALLPLPTRALQVEVKTTKGVFVATMGGYGYDEDPTRHYGKGYGKVINTLDALIVPKLK